MILAPGAHPHPLPRPQASLLSRPGKVSMNQDVAQTRSAQSAALRHARPIRMKAAVVVFANQRDNVIKVAVAP
jgi:hypothetical protein